MANTNDNTACVVEGCGAPGMSCRYCGGAVCDAHAASGGSCCDGGASAPRSISVTTSADAGCEWDEADQDAYVAACVAALERAYPGADVEMEVASPSRGDFRTRAEVEGDGIEAHDVLRIVQGVWDEASFWPARDA